MRQSERPSESTLGSDRLHVREPAKTGLERERDRLKTTVAELRAKLTRAELSLKNGKFAKRLPKAQGRSSLSRP